MINLDQLEPQMQTFWSNMSLELFKNVKLLYEQIETQFMERAADDSLGAQMAVRNSDPGAIYLLPRLICCSCSAFSAVATWLRICANTPMVCPVRPSIEIERVAI